VLKRQWWVVLGCVVVSGAVAVALSARQASVYEASAKILLSRQDLASSLTGTTNAASSGGDFDRVVQTQAELARTPEVASRALRIAKLSQTPDAFLTRATAVASLESDLITLTVRDGSRTRAVTLANAYARGYTNYREELDTLAVRRALREVRLNLASMRSGDARNQDRRLYNSLVDKEQQLRTLEVLQTSNALVARAATDAERVKPRPFRNGVLGVILGLLLGLGLAFLRSTLDTRIRTTDELATRLGLPLLARVAPLPKDLPEDALAIAARPESATAESVRMLRTQLDFAALDRSLTTLLVTSATQGEGKSTIAANLAFACAQSGENVALIDLDLRRPRAHRLFRIDQRPGATDVALGSSELAAAARAVYVDELADASHAHNESGHLDVIPAGLLPPRPGDFVGREVLGSLLADLRTRYDRVIIDTTPAVSIGDAMALSRHADGILVVAHLEVLSHNLVAEMSRLLQAAPTPALGFVATRVEVDDLGYAYGGYASDASSANGRSERFVRS
jgi:succinoglycan biosynthesis transport protein ExoP